MIQIDIAIRRSCVRVDMGWRKNALKNEDDLAESRKLGTWEIILREILFQKKIFHILIYLVDMAIWMSNFDNFDIVQISSKFAQRYHFVSNLNCKIFSILSSLDNAKNA